MSKYFEDRNRRTGRTSRMLGDAIKLASEGRTVYVLVSRNTFNFAYDKLRKLTKPVVYCLNRPYAEFANGLKLESGVPSGFDWVVMRPLGSHPNCVFLVDHEVIERQSIYRAVDYMAHKYDKRNWTWEENT